MQPEATEILREAWAAYDAEDDIVALDETSAGVSTAAVRHGSYMQRAKHDPHRRTGRGSPH